MVLPLMAVAVLCCGIFAGAAIYINVVEHPARMEGGVALALTQWAPSYRRATLMQAPLAMPFTFLALMPTNHARSAQRHLWSSFACL